MRCPTLAELPPPPLNQTGWPWTVASPPIEDDALRDCTWPRISIVTPSFNQGPFLEATIRSVLLQGYPNLEYIVIDGGSTDNSVEIIQKYEPWIAHWVSTADRGQADGINKGFRQATGQILGWLNSDDFYEPGALQVVGTYFAGHPECDLLYGDGWCTDANGTKIYQCYWTRPFDRKLLPSVDFILQPAALWRQSLWERAGELDVSCQFTMDWEWFIRATTLGQSDYLPVDLACWRMRPEIKTLSGGRARRAEIASVSRKYAGAWSPTNLDYQFERIIWILGDRLGQGLVGQIAQFPVKAIRWPLRRTLWKGRFM